MVTPIEFMVPAKTLNESNQRSANHWQKTKRASAHRSSARLCGTAAAKGYRIPLPCVVKMTRLSIRTLDDDGLRSALKAVRDGLADWLGVDDGDVCYVRFKYDQSKCKRGEFGVLVQVYPGMRLVETMEPANDVRPASFEEAAKHAEAALDIAESGRMRPGPIVQEGARAYAGKRTRVNGRRHG